MTPYGDRDARPWSRFHDDACGGRVSRYGYLRLQADEFRRARACREARRPARARYSRWASPWWGRIGEVPAPQAGTGR